MTFRNIHAGKTQLVAMRAAVLLVAVAMGGNAVAAVNCGAKPSHHAGLTQCRALHLPVKAEAAAQSDDGKLTPLSTSQMLTARAHKAKASSLDLRLSAVSVTSSPVGAAVPQESNGRGASPNATAGDLPIDRHPVTASVADAGHSLGDILHSDHSAMPTLPAPMAWTILLAGLLGLCALARAPRVARVQSWAAALPSRAYVRTGTRSRVIDRLDPARYAEVPVLRSHQGHFARASARTRFGAGY